MDYVMLDADPRWGLASSDPNPVAPLYGRTTELHAPRKRGNSCEFGLPDTLSWIRAWFRCSVFCKGCRKALTEYIWAALNRH